MNKLNVRRCQVARFTGGMTFLLSGILAITGSAYAADVIEEIIVTAQKREQSLQEVPMSVSVVSGAKLDSFGIDGFEELDDHVPNLVIGDSPGNNQIFLRGIGSQAGNQAVEQSVALFVNGVYGGRARQFQSPFFDVERIEVLRGPQGALVGKNTSAGAISVTTRKPTEETELMISTDYEFEYESNTISAIASGAVSDNFFGRLAIQRSEIGGYVANTGTGSDNPDGERLLVRATGVTDITDSLAATFVVEYADWESEGHAFVNALTGTKTLIYERAVSAPEREDQNSLNLIATLDWNLDNDFSFVSITALSDLESDNLFDGDMQLVPVSDARFIDDFNQFSQEIRLLSPEAEQFNYVLGLYYLDREVKLGTDVKLALGPFAGDWFSRFTEDAQLYSIYGQFNYSFSDTLSASSSLRFTEEEKEGNGERRTVGFIPIWLATPLSDGLSDTETDGSVSLQWEPNDNAMIYLSYTQGSKSGGFAGAGTNITQPDFALGPESSESVEVGTKLTLLDGSLFISAAYFSTVYEDLQVSAYDGMRFNITNAGEAEVDGFELDFIWALDEHWRLSGSLGLMDAAYSEFPSGDCVAPDHIIPGCAADLSGVQLAFAPDYSGTLDLEYANQVGNGLTFTGAVGVTFRDDTYMHASLMPEALQESHNKMNLRLELASESGWMLAVVGKNLTDEETFSQAFETPLSAPPGVPDHFLATRLVDRGRTIALEAAYRF